jgi:glutaredoxin 3
MPVVKVYTKDPCPYCNSAKALLNERGIPFEEIKLSWSDHEAFMELAKKSGMKTVPQIFADEKLIGGYQELSMQDQKDQLASLK